MQAAPVMPGLEELGLFDSCVTLGRFSSEICIPGAGELVAPLDRYAIAEALVHDYHARGIYPLAHGNRRLLEAVKGQPRLHPVWVLEPPLRPDPADAERVVADMLAAGVRAARLRVRAKGALAWLWEELLGALESHRVPCFLDYGSPESTQGDLSDVDVDMLRSIVLAHPDLPFILSHVMGGLGVHPGVTYLLRRVPNLHLDITGILEYWREAAKDAGPERILFATGMPFTDPGILVSNVQYARGLSTSEKRLICGGTLRRLLGGVR
jgi:predicted TIM-barrel fold metal-dependent hydrolase